MRRFIRLGDKTSHGGTVTSASSRMFVGGIPVACIGDTCTCPKKGHNNCVIVEGDDIMTVDGRAIALEGCKCSCGAVLISSMPNAGRVYEGSAASAFSAASTSPAATESFTPDLQESFGEDAYIEFQLTDQYNKPIGEQNYVLTMPGGKVLEGDLDADGYVRIDGVRPGTCKIEFPNLGLSGTV